MALSSSGLRRDELLLTTETEQIWIQWFVQKGGVLSHKFLSCAFSEDTDSPTLTLSPSPSAAETTTQPQPQPQAVTPILSSSTTKPSSALNRFNPLPSISHKSNDGVSDTKRGGYPRPAPRKLSESSASRKTPKHADSEKVDDANNNQTESFKNLQSQLRRLKTEESVQRQAPDAKTQTEKMRSQQPMKSDRHKAAQRAHDEPVIVSVCTDPEPEFQPLRRKVFLPAEPTPSEDHFILAVKLPSGQRPQRRFRPTDTLQTVMNFAESSARLDFEGCELVCDVPSHIVFRNLNVVIAKSGLRNRTVLHVQIPDQD